MALGHSTIPDDWDAYSYEPGAPTYFPMPYNPMHRSDVPLCSGGPPELAGHGNYMLRFGPNAYNGADPGVKFLHKSVLLAHAGNQSSRMFWACGNGEATGACHAYPIVRADEALSAVNGYRMGVYGGNLSTAEIILYGNQGYTMALGHSTLAIKVNAASLPNGFAQVGAGKWWGLRLDCQTVGNDVWLQGFIATGHARCEAALLEEASWLRVINCYHLPGGVVLNVPEPGVDYTQVTDFSGNAPILSGRPGFVVTKAQYVNNYLGWVASPHVVALP